MLFADVVGYSTLPENYLPVYIHDFLVRVSHELAQLPHRPLFVNTWGDALFAVMDEATGLIEYAFALHNAVAHANAALPELPKLLEVRVALHAGPVYADVDPFTGKENFYGAHVNRAARIEPVTLPGHIYASEQFVALLTVEQIAIRQKARQAGQPALYPFICEYVGVLALAKNFGPQVVYHVRKRAAAEAG